MQKTQNKFKITFGQALMGVIVLVLAIGLVLNYVSLNEVSAKLSDATEHYEKLCSEEESLKYEITQQVNPENIEQLASELNMVKLDPHQIRYFDIVEADSMSTSIGKDEQNGLLDGIVYSFNILVEYLK